MARDVSHLRILEYADVDASLWRRNDDPLALDQHTMRSECARDRDKVRVRLQHEQISEDAHDKTVHQ